MNYKMKRTIILNENEFKKLVEDCVKMTLNEWKYKGVSYHGTNPYDWADIADERDRRGTQILQAKKRLLSIGEKDAADLADKEYDKNDDKYIHDRRMARELGYNRNVSRQEKAQEYYDLALQAKTPEEKQKYIKLANDILGDVEGRAMRALKDFKQS